MAGRLTTRVFVCEALLALVGGACGGSLSVNPFADQGPLRLELETVATGLVNPLDLQPPSDGTRRLFVAEQRGTIRIVQNGTLLSTPFLDISGIVESGGEMGLLGLAFHPNYRQNRRFFVNYTRRVSGQLQSVIAEFRGSAFEPNVADPDPTILLVVVQPFDNHNGGQLAFGPEGYLYIAFGDGGSGGDPLGNAQNLNTLLGKLLRIDVNSGSPYAIPPDNPFASQPGARGEIWAYGLRNPWRFSFDRDTGRLYAADVGQDDFEEVDLITRGGNYGWNIMEGAHCYPPPSTVCNSAGLILPVVEYAHGEGESVTGGYVYRGSLIPELRGVYIFGDFISGRIWSLKETSPGLWERSLLLETSLNISSLGRDQSGEVYVVDYSGTIRRFRRSTSAASP